MSALLRLLLLCLYFLVLCLLLTGPRWKGLAYGQLRDGRRSGSEERERERERAERERERERAEREREREHRERESIERENRENRENRESRERCV